ncbi:MAG: thiamine phosphate synthase [Alphaproteobacteria bacterium]|nr:thiamine phosphate synthase [Alphaproteobacteria bacterium]MCB9930111.1 thiamine phosphate synthase [Alphaproteobacteria bacterium]
MRPLPSPPVLLITDRGQAGRPLPDVVAAAFDGGCRWVSLREKDLPAHDRRRLAETLVKRAEPYKARVGVHDDVALAASLGLRALHLPAGGDVTAAKRRADPRCLIGRSCHTAEAVAAAAAAGADYASLSPIFLTRSKPGYGPALGVDRLAAIAGGSPLPLVALGGLTPERVAACRATGAKGIAVMGEVMRADDPARVMRAFVEAWNT